MRFSVLGVLEVTVDSRPVDLGRPLQRALLAFLILERDRPVPLSTIIDLLWDADSGPADPRASVQTHIARLRRALESDPSGGHRPDSPSDDRARRPLIERVGDGYRLSAPAGAVDAEEFTDLAALAQRLLHARRPADALAAAERALRLWRGPQAAPELAERRPAQPHLVRLAQARLGCAEDRADALAALGRHAEAIAELEQLTSAYPLRERCWLLLIRALHATGRTAEALECYQQLREVLDTELGIEPGAALRAVHLQILRGEPDPPAVEPAVPAQPLIGRRPEIAVLDKFLADAATAVRFGLIEGEAGIGKTALARHCASAAIARGMAVAWGHCHQDDDRPALWPWRQVLGALDSGRGDTSARLPAVMSGTFETFDAVLDDLVEASRRRPLLIILDDLQWADPASLKLLSFLAVELADARIAVLATGRPEPSPDLHRTRTTLARTAEFRRLQIGPLDVDDTATLIRRRAGSVDDQQALALHARSGGNPFFAGELAALLADPGRAAGLPSAVLDAVEHRLAGLPAGARRTLELAAVLGERFGLDRLLEVAGGEADRAVHDLDAAIGLGLLHTDDLVIRFDHALVRETLLVGCSDIRQRRLHTQIAAAGGADQVTLAFHLWAGRPFTDPAETVAACRSAARLAEQDLAHHTAAQWWRRALEATAGAKTPPAGGASATRELTLNLAAALSRAGQTVDAQHVLAELVEDCLVVGDIRTAVDAAVVLTASGGGWVWVQWNSDPSRLVALLRRTLTALDSRPSPERVRVLCALALGYTYLDPPRMGEIADQAVEQARSLGDAAALAEALTAWMFGHWGPGADPRFIELGREAIAVAGRAARPELAALARLRLAIALVMIAEPDAALIELATVQEWADTAGQPMVSAQLHQLQGTLAALRGDFPAARDFVLQADRAMDRAGYHLRELITLSALAFHALEQGRLDEFVAELPAWSDQENDFLMFGYAELDAGRPGKALGVLARHDGFAEQPRWWNWSALRCWQAGLAVALVDSVDRSVLERMADDLAPLSGTIGCWGGIGTAGPVDRYLGALLTALGRPEQAATALERALVLSRTLDLRPSEAAVSVSLADLVTEPARRRDLLDRAGSLAAELGLRRVARQVQAARGEPPATRG